MAGILQRGTERLVSLMNDNKPTPVVHQDKDELLYCMDFHWCEQYYNVPAPISVTEEHRVVVFHATQEHRLVVFQGVCVAEHRESTNDVHVRKKTLLSKCNVFFQLLLIVLVSMCSFGMVLMHSTAGAATAPMDTPSVQSVQILQPLRRVHVHVPLPQAAIEQKRSIWARPLHTVAPGTSLMAFVPPSTTTGLVVTDLVVMQLKDFRRFMADAAETSVVVVSIQETKTTAPACVCPRDDAKYGTNTSIDAPVETGNQLVWNGVCSGMTIVGFAFVGTVFFGVIAGVTGFGSE